MYTQENLRFKIDWASLVVGSKFTIFALFYFVFEGNCPSTGGLYLEGQSNGGVFALADWGLYIWRGLLHGGAYFQNFRVHVCVCIYTVQVCVIHVAWFETEGDWVKLDDPSILRLRPVKIFKIPCLVLTRLTMGQLRMLSTISCACMPIYNK